ncbi:SIMPL domain-containing protein [Roseisolibacter sp. H3M3-2]|uniref:SIMPL domain-containing protein n=1 Tax=Roseisolibacter sp. H3M3-2 TaxID=3031323 RepID=UPI0023DAB5E3|nr:SIMPL domain-containing protein [Roseisolibacter sp. H3M3-2]MDF1504503.1 SIMPL domain-containing protein [Roseisolibacter sp. H3M3-2]
MRLLSFAALTVLAAPLAAQSPSPAPAPFPAGGPPGSIAVSAVGEEEVTPDRARVMIGVQTQAATSALAAERNARIQKAVLDTIRALGIPAELISTSGFNVYPEQVYDQATRRTRITGYNVQNNVVVEVRQLDRVGPVLDAALAKGANQIASLTLYSSQAEQARRRAMAKAVERARADAEAIARAAGGSLGGVLELTSGVEPSRPRPMMAEMQMARVGDAAGNTTISEGTQTISASVTARFLFSPVPR